jgi:hypothetical protein
VTVKSGGELRLSRNSLQQIVFGEAFLQAIAALARGDDSFAKAFTGVFRDVSVTDNSFASFPNELAAQSLSVASNVFQTAVAGYCGVGVAGTATYAGNLANQPPQGQMVIQAIADAQEAAANARIAIVMN